MLSYTYTDPLLKGLVSQNNEDVAVADVAAFNANFTDNDLAGIIPYRAYVLACIDNVKDAQDMFATKKKFYEKEFDSAVALARSRDKTGVAKSIFSISIERA
jgi:hypothetical protein